MTKKIIGIVATLALVAVLATCLVACVPSSATKATEKLEKAGYIVYETEIDKDEEEEGVVGYVAAGKANNIISAALSADKVYAYWFTTADEAKDFADSMKNIMTYKVNGKCAYYCSSEAAAKDFE